MAKRTDNQTQPSGLGRFRHVFGGLYLPKALTRDETDALLARLPDPGARDELIRHNLRLIVHIAKKFEASDIEPDDLVSLGGIGLIKAIDSFRPEKNVKLATYASRCIQNEILMELRRNRKHPPTASLDEPVNENEHGGEPLCLEDVLGTEPDEVERGLEEKQDALAAYGALEKLPDVLWTIAVMRYGLYGIRPMSQADVAEWLGFSQSYVSRLETKAVRQLKQSYRDEQ